LSKFAVKKKKKLVPKGTSPYQAAWILESDGEGESEPEVEESEDEEMQEEQEVEMKQQQKEMDDQEVGTRGGKGEPQEGMGSLALLTHAISEQKKRKKWLSWRKI
jgi:hypothetical protein